VGVGQDPTLLAEAETRAGEKLKNYFNLLKNLYLCLELIINLLY
jgi:hypothetical protein